MTNSYYDFFAGGGMVSFGLGDDWECTFANEIDVKKAASYKANHDGGKELTVDDVANIQSHQLKGKADLIWASFPCQDLSLAGNRAGLNGERSGTFRQFTRLMHALKREGRKPAIIAVENVYGTISSNGGADFLELAKEFFELGYSFGALVIDASFFLPQSRPRFFMIGFDQEFSVPSELQLEQPSSLWHPKSLVAAHDKLPSYIRSNWIWWMLPEPVGETQQLASLVEDEPTGTKWHSDEETAALIGMMSKVNLEKVLDAKNAGERVVGTIYRRTRKEADGLKRQRAEVRFDGIAGCLRTPSGGSSRQTIIIVDGDSIRTRLLSPRETARLMGLPDSYALPEKYNDAYKLAGDGVAVPVVEHLNRWIFSRLLNRNGLAKAA